MNTCSIHTSEKYISSLNLAAEMAYSLENAVREFHSCIGVALNAENDRGAYLALEMLLAKFKNIHRILKSKAAKDMNELYEDIRHNVITKHI